MIRRLLRDGAVYALASIASRALALLLLPVYSRVFAPAEYGRFDLVTTLGLLVSMVVTFEVGQGLARLWHEAADGEARARLASTALAFSTAGHMAFLALAWIAAPWIAEALLGDAALASTWRAGAAFIAVQGVAMLAQAQFRWELRPRGFAIASVGHAVALAAIGLGAAMGLGLGLEGLLWGQTFAAGASTLVCLLVLRKTFSARPARDALRSMLAFSAPLVPAGAAVFASFYANRFLLAGLGTLDDVGVFGVGLRIASVIALLIVGVQGALTPLVYAHHADPSTPASLARFFEAFVAVALPACLALGLFAPELVLLLSTPEYAAAAPLVIWLAPATLLTQMYVFAPGISIAKKTSQQLVISVVAAVVGVLGNALLIGPLGGLGAAIATFGAAVLFFGAWLFASQRLYRLPLRAGPLLAACFVTAALAFAAPAGIVLRTACVAACVVVVFALGLIRRHDLQQIATLAKSLMCGIVVALTPGAPTRAGTIAAMAATMRHRGPDDEGHLLFDGREATLFGGDDTPEAVWSTPTPSTPRERIDAAPMRAAALAMGHRRLSIIDLSPHGHQPMRRGDAFVVYNGEIYNHVELRAELEGLGRRFHSGSDTEVLLAALAQWGPEALNRLNGMWAFAMFDAARRTLFVARDRFGVKPLYLWRRGDALLLASEIKALLVHPLVRAAPDPARCAAYLRHGPSAWDEATEFEGITRFPAGCFAEVPIDAPARFEPRAWWRSPRADPAIEAVRFDADEARRHTARYAELLDEAVRLRLRADVRVGTALSGGLDSSSIALLVNDELRRRGAARKQEVFSSVYADPALGAYDESAFIERVATRLDVRSNRIEPQVSDVPAAHEQVIRALEEPPAGTLMSSWHTFKLVRERGVTVTLDGQGADEQLAGYARYTRNRLVHAGLGAAIGEARSIAGSMQGFGSHVAIGLAGHLARRVAGRARLAAAVKSLGMGSDPSATLGEALAGDFDRNLRNLLLYADKTSMAWSVESRMPFMDWRLVEWLATVPPAYKIHAGWTKWLAREAFADRLPAEVAWRRDKMGWPVPEPVWFGGPLARWLDETIASSAFVAALGGAADASLAARVRALNLAVWHRVFFKAA